MALGELHVLVGMGLCAVEPERWWLALPLAVASHVPLDDLNEGPVARLYHGVGTGWRRIVVGALRGAVIASIAYIGWRDPILLAVGLPAWLAWDFEWIVGAMIGRHGLGLHERMWQPWMYTEWSLVPLLVAMGLFIGMLWP